MEPHAGRLSVRPSGWTSFGRLWHDRAVPAWRGCRHSRSLHIASDLVITEIVDPASGSAVAAGESGEVVFTNIVGDSQPLLRYRSGDIARLATDGACACGFTGARLRDAIEARVDDMVWIRDMNVFPSAIEAVVRGFDGLGDEYEIVVEGPRALPTLRVRAERKSGTDAPGDELARQLRIALIRAIRATAEVEIVPFGTVRRSDGRTKHRRVIDRRGEPV